MSSEILSLIIQILLVTCNKGLARSNEWWFCRTCKADNSRVLSGQREKVLTESMLTAGHIYGHISAAALKSFINIANSQAERECCSYSWSQSSDWLVISRNWQKHLPSRTIPILFEFQDKWWWAVMQESGSRLVPICRVFNLFIFSSSDIETSIPEITAFTLIQFWRAHSCFST